MDLEEAQQALNSLQDIRAARVVWVSRAQALATQFAVGDNHSADVASASFVAAATALFDNYVTPAVTCHRGAIDTALTGV